MGQVWHVAICVSRQMPMKYLKHVGNHGACMPVYPAGKRNKCPLGIGVGRVIHPPSSQGLREADGVPINRGGTEPGPSSPSPPLSLLSPCDSESCSKTPEPCCFLTETQTSHLTSPSISFLICKNGAITAHPPSRGSGRVQRGCVCEVLRPAPRVWNKYRQGWQ